MRPISLEIEGFASFRERTEVDFSDLALFALTGPTGSGKSSLIDAISFALYGSIPRYRSQKVIAPVISSGKREARVRLTFTVGNTTYAAVRVLRATKQGASTKEARLENEQGKVLAGNADELSKEIQKLLGLSFGEFTKCVVIPQGDFAAFLSASGKERQDLLVRLLALDSYRKVAKLARQRADCCKTKAYSIQQRLAQDYAQATPKHLATVKKRLDAIGTFQTKLSAIEPILSAHQEKHGELQKAIEANTARVNQLQQIRIPSDLQDLSKKTNQLNETLSTAQEALKAATQSREAIQTQLEQLPRRSELENIQAQYAQHKQLHGCLEELSSAHRDQQQACQHVAVSLAQTTAQHKEQSDRLTHLEHQSKALALVPHLQLGEPCPVCLQSVSALPQHPDSEAMEDVRAQVHTLEKAVKQHSEQKNTLDQAIARLEAQREATQQQLRELEQQLQDKIPAEEIVSTLKTIDVLAQKSVSADTEKRTNEDKQQRITQQLAALEKKNEIYWQRFDHLRDQQAAYGPPMRIANDLYGSWQALVEWAEKECTNQQGQVSAYRQDLAQKEAEIQQQHETLAALCTEYGLAMTDTPTLQDIRLQAESEKTKAEVAKLNTEEAIEKATQLRAECDTAVQQGAVAKTLGNLLSAQKFEAWLVQVALERLTVSANKVLHDLSNGAYSLSIKDGDSFDIIDHHNADTKRPAKTLSGGETFLASLALALGLRAQVALIAAESRERLEALFLDEGFGTLDPQTLETVSDAIEELSVQGRMVGIITHVAELADRMPVRFQLSKENNTTRVEKIAA